MLMLDRWRLSFCTEFRRIKNFCACDATCVGVRDTTKFLEMFRQSPLPCFCKPSRNSRCSSSVHGTPFRRSSFPFVGDLRSWLRFESGQFDVNHELAYGGSDTCHSSILRMSAASLRQHAPSNRACAARAHQ